MLQIYYYYYYYYTHTHTHTPNESVHFTSHIFQRQIGRVKSRRGLCSPLSSTAARLLWSGPLSAAGPSWPLAGPSATFSRGFPLGKLTVTNPLSIGTNCSHGILLLCRRMKWQTPAALCSPRFLIDFTMRPSVCG